MLGYESHSSREKTFSKIPINHFHFRVNTGHFTILNQFSSKIDSDDTSHLFRGNEVFVGEPLARRMENKYYPSVAGNRVTYVSPNTMPMSLGKPDDVLPLTMVKPPLRSPPPCSIKPWVMPTGMSNVWTPYWAEKLPS